MPSDARALPACNGRPQTTSSAHYLVDAGTAVLPITPSVTQVATAIFLDLVNNGEEADACARARAAAWAEPAAAKLANLVERATWGDERATKVRGGLPSLGPRRVVHRRASVKPNSFAAGLLAAHLFLERGSHGGIVEKPAQMPPENKHRRRALW